MIFFVMKANLMHYLSLIYFVKKPLHVSGIPTDHHQEPFTVYVQQLVRVIRLDDWQLAGSKWNSSILHIYREYLLMMGNKHARNM
jgi:Tfp pilus assembly protein PilO